jgi:hypothetical protein
VTSYTDGKDVTPQVLGAAAVHGYTVAFWVAAGIFAVGALVVSATMRGVRGAPQTAGAPAAGPVAS